MEGLERIEVPLQTEQAFVSAKYAERDARVKAVHGRGVRRITVDGYAEGETFAAYVKFPDMATIAQAMGLVQANDAIGASTQLFNKCVLQNESDQEIFADTELRWAVSQVLPELMMKKKAQLHQI